MCAHTRSEFYERPVHRIIDETEQVLYNAHSLVLKCCNNGFIKRPLVIIPAADFRKVPSQLESSAANACCSWAYYFVVNDQPGINISLPPIAANNPILGWIGGYISMLYYCSPDDRYNAKLIVDEVGIVPLLKLLKEGRIEEQVIAAKTIGTLGCNSETIQPIIDAGVCLVFAKILVQAEVAWPISQLVANCPQCRDIFAQHNIIRLLVEHLAFETDHVQNVVVMNNATSVLAIVMAKTRLDMSKAIDECNNDKPYHGRSPHQANSSLPSFEGDDLEDPNVKAHIKAMVARALLQLAKGNSSICCSITEWRAMTSFAVLLEKGTEDVQYSSAMALMEITEVAEQDTVLRRSAFKPSSPACKEVVDQLVKVIERQDTNLLIPSKLSEGSPHSELIENARLLRVRGYSFARLIRHLSESEAEICREALIALRKFACTENHLHLEHSQAIVDLGGVDPIIQLVGFGDKIAQVPALILLCNIALHVPNGEVLVRALDVIECATKQGNFTQDEMLQILIPESKSRLELYYTSD
ncbi:uncharacterized protein LOC110673544 [Hevea brasiliensis]|uniref:uncharacterized protein LOC110673544 n=1 Tax=Hevea brasiliensis TaxID=3981 RepID=UPI0025D41E2A|nr:uncharacterized protein LOC110673544 [Hevea brasiliensis]